MLPLFKTGLFFIFKMSIRQYELEDEAAAASQVLS